MKDPLIDLVERTFVDIFQPATIPGKWLVDIIPQRELTVAPALRKTDLIIH